MQLTSLSSRIQAAKPFEDAVYFEDATGKTSAIGNITFEEYIGGYWILSGQSEFASAMATLYCRPIFTGGSFTPVKWTARSSDSYTYSGSISGYDMQSSMLTVTGNTNINLSWNTTNGWYDNGSLSRADIFSNGYYTLEPIATGSIKVHDGSPVFEGVITIDPQSAGDWCSQIPTITRNQTLLWQPSGASWVMFFFIVRSADQMSDEQRINCIA